MNVNVKSHLVADLVGDRPADGLWVVDLDGVAVVMVVMVVVMVVMVVVTLVMVVVITYKHVYGDIIIYAYIYP